MDTLYDLLFHFNKNISMIIVNYVEFKLPYEIELKLITKELYKDLNNYIGYDHYFIMEKERYNHITKIQFGKDKRIRIIVY